MPHEYYEQSYSWIIEFASKYSQIKTAICIESNLWIGLQIINSIRDLWNIFVNWFVNRKFNLWFVKYICELILQITNSVRNWFVIRKIYLWFIFWINTDFANCKFINWISAALCVGFYTSSFSFRGTWYVSSGSHANRIVNCGFVNWDLWIVNCELWIVNCELWIGHGTGRATRAGLAHGLPRVRVRVGDFVPHENPYPSYGSTGSSGVWIPLETASTLVSIATCHLHTTRKRLVFCVSFCPPPLLTLIKWASPPRQSPNWADRARENGWRNPFSHKVFFAQNHGWPLPDTTFV